MKIVKYVMFSTLFIFCSSAFGQSLNYQNMLNQWVSLSSYQFKEPDKFVDWCFRKMDRETYDRVKNDEFEFYSKFEEMREKCNSSFKNYSEESYVITTDVTFDEYDFNKKAYPVNIDIEPSSFFYSSGNMFEIPDNAALSFIDISIFRDVYIPMEMSEAKAFLNRRKDRYGNVNRELTLELKVKVVDAKDEYIKSGRSFYNEYINLIGEIESAVILEKNRTLLKIK